MIGVITISVVAVQMSIMQNCIEIFICIGAKRQLFQLSKSSTNYYNSIAKREENTDEQKRNDSFIWFDCDGRDRLFWPCGSQVAYLANCSAFDAIATASASIWAIMPHCCANCGSFGLTWSIDTYVWRASTIKMGFLEDTIVILVSQVN